MPGRILKGRFHGDVERAHSSRRIGNCGGLGGLDRPSVALGSSLHAGTQKISSCFSFLGDTKAVTQQRVFCSSVISGLSSESQLSLVTVSSKHLTVERQ